MAWNYKTTGIPDGEFIRGKVPITKCEVRAVALSKLKLQSDSHVLDVGCGTGSVSVEAALLCSEGMVVGVDRNEEAVELTRQNGEKFGVRNLEVIAGSAPGCLPDRFFDRIFLGGGSVQLDGIVSYAKEHLKEQGVLVANTILLDSTVKALQVFEEHGFKNIECICLNIARGEKVSGWMMKALNPIYIISGEK